MSVEAFLASTPYLTNLQARATGRARRDLAVTAAWHAEAFARTKELPDLAELLNDTDTEEGSAVVEARVWAERCGFTFETVH